MNTTALDIGPLTAYARAQEILAQVQKENPYSSPGAMVCETMRRLREECAYGVVEARDV